MRTDLGPTTVGRIAACLLIGGGTLTAVTLPLPHPPGMNAPATFLTALAAVVVGMAAYVAPWDRWPRRMSLALAPVAFALIAVGNVFGSSRPYSYSIFFIVTFTWIGLSQPRWTSLLLAGPAAVAYVTPMFVRDGASRIDALGALFAIPVCVLVAEVIAWTVAAQRAHRQRALSLARVASAIGQQLDEHRLSQTLVDEARVALDSEQALLFRLDPVSSTVAAVHSSGLPEDVQRFVDQSQGTTIGQLPDALSRGDPMIVADTDAEPSVSDLVRRFGVKSFMAVPVLSRGSLVAVLTCWETSRRRRYTSDDLAFGRALAGQAGAAIETARLYERSVEASRIDSLTGLQNRRAFRDRLEAEIERARRHSRPLSLVLLDCDRFKRINDQLGHQRGDRALERIGAILQRNRRTEDDVYRIGGDEFAAILPETDVAGAAVIADRLRRNLKRIASTELETPPVTASFGVAEFGEHGLTADDLFRQADAALYDAKGAGGNATALPMPSSAFAPLGVDIESILRSRLIGVSFQPIFDLSTGDVFAFEALARVDRVVSRAPAQTIFRASAVVGKAEVLDRLCTQAAIGALGDLPDGSSLFVNLSLSAVASRSFVEDLVRDLEYAQLCPAHVVIEMTGDDGTGAQVDGRALESWKDRGFRIAMGGFIGTRSDMDLVSSVPFDYVEIDVTSSDPASSTRVRMSYLAACVTRIRESGAEPIAVRIETIDDLRIAHDSGFFGAQGMFLREPEPFLNGAPRPLGTASTTSVDAARL